MLDDRVSDHLMLAVGFYGDAVSFAHGSFGGWQSFGPARRATKAIQQRALRTGRRTGAGHLQTLSRRIRQGLAASRPLFPFAILSHEREETGLIRTLLGINEADGSLTLAGGHSPGRLISSSCTLPPKRWSTAPRRRREAARLMANEAASNAGQSLAILISCIGRKLVGMGDRG